jgi:hypothetical protein
MTRTGHCYECSRIMRVGARVGEAGKCTEGHHPFGRNISAFTECVVDMPGNWHRVLDARRADRPEIPKRPGDNPLHQIASIVVTLGEAADAFADYARREEWPEWVSNLGTVFGEVAHSAADWLLILAGRLDAEHGPSWAEKLDMPPPWQK